MVTYDALLAEWAKCQGMNLRIGTKPICCVRIPPDGLELHLDLDTKEDELILSILLGAIALGGYGDQILRAALIYNGTSQQPRGTLSYSKKLGNLLIHERLPLGPCSVSFLQNRIQILSAMAKTWKQSIEKQTIPIFEDPPTIPSPLSVYTSGGSFT